MMRDTTNRRPGKTKLQLDVRARYLTPLGRVCRLVTLRAPRPGLPLEATFAYLDGPGGHGVSLPGDRLTLTESVAARVLVRVG